MDVAAGTAKERIDWRQVRLLLALNWRVRINAAMRTPLTTVLGIMLFLMFGVFALIGSGWLGVGIAGLAAGPERELAGAAVHEVYFAVFFLIVVTPVLGFRGSEFLDVTKLFVYPLGHRTAFAATLIGLMTSGAVLFFGLPVFAAVLGYSIGVDASAGELAAALVSALLLVLAAVALGQFVLLAFLNTLKSRKWRDLSMVLVPLVIGSAYVAFSILSRTRGDGSRSQMMLASVRWFASWKDWTLPLPSWWAAHAVEGTGLARLLPLAALAALIAWLVRASAVLQERAFFGESAETTDVEGVGARGLLGRFASNIGGPLGALVEKELAILKREPAVRSILIGQMIYPIAWGGLGVYRVISSHSVEELGAMVPLTPALAAYPLLLMELGLVMNLLGLEGGGAVHSMLLPVKPRLLLAGKNVAYLLVFGTLNAVVAIVLTIAAAVLTHTVSMSNCVVWPLLGALEGYCVVALGLGIGNVMSVISPNRVAVRDRRQLRQHVGGREGCLKGLVGLASVFGTLFLALPIACAFHLPTALSLSLSPKIGPLPSWWTIFTVPVGVLIAGGSMVAGAAIGGGLLASRTEDITARLAKSDD